MMAQPHNYLIGNHEIAVSFCWVCAVLRIFYWSSVRVYSALHTDPGRREDGGVAAVRTADGEGEAAQLTLSGLITAV